MKLIDDQCAFQSVKTRKKKQVFFLPDTEECKYKILLNSLTFILK